MNKNRYSRTKNATGAVQIASLLVKMDKRLTLFILVFALYACKITRICEGNPKPDMICKQDYDPVCGCNGKTYSNACTAEAAGIQNWTKGECK